MKTRIRFTNLLAACTCLLGAMTTQAVTNVFFNPSQTATLVVSNINAVTISSEDYLFTYSVDGYWSASPGGPPTGRFFSVFWPDGVQAQAITAGPALGSGANLTIKRVDGKLFDLWLFTGRLLANTGGAGGSFEVMPQLNGEDAFPNPLMYDATGSAGQSFPHTPMLGGYDTYKIHLWVDWALTALTLIDTNPVVPPAPNFTITTSASPVGAGMAGGGGNYPSNSTCTVIASANPGWGFQKWTENGAQVSTSANYTFTVRSNRTLAANFVPAFNIATSVSPTYGGSASGAGTFNSNSLVTVRATPIAGWTFVNWTEFGVPVSNSTNYSFTITGDRTLVANFTTNSAPFAFGCAFFQLTGQPLVINITDLMWSDYDPDGDPITFVGVSVTSSNGLALTTNATQILVPANTLADGFSYTIADSFGAIASGTATIFVITNAISRGVSLDRAPDGTVTIGFTGVPWYFYEAQRATNATFSGTLQTWPAQAWSDGSIYVWDDFADLANEPSQAFYRLRYTP